MIKIDAIFLAVREAEYTSKQSGKLVKFTEIQTLLDGAICKWSFSNLSKTLNIAKFKSIKSGEEVILYVEIQANNYEKDKPIVVLVDVE